MSTITLANSTSKSQDRSAEFRLFQGKSQIARIGVHAGASIGVPTTASYSAQVSTKMGNLALTSNTVNFTSPSANLLAQVLVENGYYDFQLSLLPGTQAYSILCENTWREPVQFSITMPGTPVQIVTVVDEHNNESISTVQEWTCYAIVNGITTASVTTTDPSATVTLFADNNDDAFRLVVS